MSRRLNPAMPSVEFGLLLVEGGDEAAVCQVLAGSTWSQLCCWKADGRDLARLARNDANFRHARSVGVVLDAEASTSAAFALAEATLANLGVVGPIRQGVLAGELRAGAFVTPDGASPGAIESLCRLAVRDPQLSACVDALVACAGTPHAARDSPRVAEDKGWLRAYLGMLSQPDLRFHQAFAHPRGIDPMHPAFAPLRQFLLAL
jgi:hypothetical protein